jgi:trans-aconitate 2-methyltransferase
MTNFRWNPNEYAASSSAQLVWAKELIAKLNLTGKEEILDIGCGDGKITAEISRYLPDGKVIGIDNSREMIEYASANFNRSDYPNLEFYNLDARSFELDEKFDFVFSNATLHWFEDHLSVLKHASNVMKTKAGLIISCGGKGNAEEVMKVMNDIIKTKKWEKYFRTFSFKYFFYDTKDYPEWLQKAGLKPIRVNLIPKDMVQSGKEGLSGWIRTTWLPYIHSVPEKLREEFIFNVVENYIKKFPMDVNGKIHVSMVRLEVEAIKI